MTDIAPQIWLGPAQFAHSRGVKRPTVMSWIKDGRLPEARQLPDRTWQIPADAELLPAPPAAAVVDIRPPAGGSGISRPAAPAVPELMLADLLEDLPAFVPLDVAAVHLGIPESSVRRNRADFDLKPYGPYRSLMMPLRRLRELRGEL